MRLERPLAYHITFGTYGSRLHGDERLTVDREHNEYGAPFLIHDEERRTGEAASLRRPPVELTMEQRLLTEATIPGVCDRGGWTYHIAACRPDHVHVLLAAEQEGKAVRKWLKRWLGEAISSRWRSHNRQDWWAEGGSVKWIWQPEYLEAAYEYIERQRASESTERGLP
jgi:REP element-mobilizing transposase RayT